MTTNTLAYTQGLANSATTSMHPMRTRHEEDNDVADDYAPPQPSSHHPSVLSRLPDVLSLAVGADDSAAHVTFGGDNRSGSGGGASVHASQQQQQGRTVRYHRRRLQSQHQHEDAVHARVNVPATAAGGDGHGVPLHTHGVTTFAPAPAPELFDSEVEKSRSRSDNYGVNNYTRHLLHLHHQHVNMDDSSSPSCSSAPADAQAWRLRQQRLMSYFDADNTSSEFSWQNELDCLADYVHHLLHTIEEDRLPWLTDFADVDKMRAPRTRAEVLARLNLNVPYYASNYLQLCYAVTLPFLLLYNRAFLLVVAAACLLAHTIAIRRKYTHTYSRAAVLLGRRVPYHALGHALLASLLVLFVFFDGLKTTALVLLLNALVVVPHALWRIPTYFDDEDLEKLRPKLVQYALLLCFLVLAYLEGDVDAPEEEGKKAAKREMDRLGLTHLYAKRRRLRRRSHLS